MNTERLLGILHGAKLFAILTANEPAFEPADSGGNAALRSDLRALGLAFTPLHGVYQGKPDGESFLVHGLDADTALLLGRKYGQNEVVAGGALVETRTGLALPWTGEVLLNDRAREQDYHSVVKNLNGTDGIAFSLVFDFDAEREPLENLNIGAAAIYA